MESFPSNCEQERSFQICDYETNVNPCPADLDSERVEEQNLETLEEEGPCGKAAFLGKNEQERSFQICQGFSWESEELYKNREGKGGKGAKKRDMRAHWIQMINAGTRYHGVNHGNFMHGLMKENIQLNRKILSELSMHEPYSFKALVDLSRNVIPGNKAAIDPKKEGLAILVLSCPALS